MILILGVALGLVSSFLGIGGGIFLVPLLPKIYDLSAYESIVLSLLFILISVSINTVVYSLSKKIVWSLVLKMSVFIVIGAIVGSQSAQHVPDLYLRLFLMCFLFLMGLGFIKKYLQISSSNEIDNLSSDDLKQKNQNKWMAQIAPRHLGLFSGVLSGFSGVGSGVFLNWLVLNDSKVRSEEEAPTVNAMMIFVCLGVFISTFWTRQALYIELFDKVGLFNFIILAIGITGGSHLGKKLNSKNLNQLRILILAILTFVLSLSVLVELVSAL